MGAAPLSVGFLFVCTFKRTSRPVFVSVHVCVCVCSAWKGKRMRANWVSQEAGLESDLISLMCDQCEWEAGTQKATVAMQLGLLQTTCWGVWRHKMGKTPNGLPFPSRPLRTWAHLRVSFWPMPHFNITEKKSRHFSLWTSELKIEMENMPDEIFCMQIFWILKNILKDLNTDTDGYSWCLLSVYMETLTMRIKLLLKKG